MSYDTAINRVAELARLATRMLPAPPPQASFAPVLAAALDKVAPQQSARQLASVAQVPAALEGSVAARVIRVAESQVGESEDPVGSNNGAAVARYRTAVAGAYSGAPWCAYFASWVAQQAGVPLGDSGEGFGAVQQVHDWAARTGRLVPAGADVRPGDLMLDGDDHMGIVVRVNADGSYETVEGNYSDGVSRVQRTAGAETSFVRLR